MRKGLVALLMLAILVVGLKYYHDSNQTPVEKQEEPKKNQPIWGGDGSGPPSPVITPPEMKLGIYWNSDCVDVVEHVDWGTLYPGQSKSVTFYLKNEGDINLSPSLNTSNWVLKDANGTVLGEEYRDYFSLTWDYNSTDITPEQILGVTLTLTISPLIKDVVIFTFDINIGW